MSLDAKLAQRLAEAVDLAIAGKWEAAHAVVQGSEGVREADWLHAVLHKIEGDEGNSRYWYRQCGHFYESYADPKAELSAIKAALTY